MAEGVRFSVAPGFEKANADISSCNCSRSVSGNGNSNFNRHTKFRSDKFSLLSSKNTSPLDSFLIFKENFENESVKCKLSGMGQEDLESISSEEDNCRKKRCSDRYDSSESSDSGVAVHCGDCGSSNSDITEPCSPLSETSLEEMPPTQSQPSWPWSDPPAKRPKQGKITEYFKSKAKKYAPESQSYGNKTMRLESPETREFSPSSPSEPADYPETPRAEEEEEDLESNTQPSLDNSSASCSSSSISSKQDDSENSESGISILFRSSSSENKDDQRTIRFPAKNGWRGHYVSDIICRWSNCDSKFGTTSALIEHLQNIHVNTQTLSEYYMCQWTDCKVFERKSCSRTWLERHVLSHGGNKPYQCIVEGCGQRFSSQTLLQRHVNNHFSEGNSKSDSKKGCEQNNKLIRRNGKKLRLRRQPFSARIYDYFDAGIMEGLQHQLMKITEKRTQGSSECPGDRVTLQSKVMGRRTDLNGKTKILIRWFPNNILCDEWVDVDKVERVKYVKIASLPNDSKDCLNSYLFGHQRLVRHGRKGRKSTAQCSDEMSAT